MNVLVNDRPCEVPLNCTVSELLAQLEFSPFVAVEVNLELVPKEQHATRTLHSGDVLEITTFKGGG